VLLIGRSPEVMDAVIREVLELDVAAQRSTEPERAADNFHAGDFDLIVFGGGLGSPVNEDLRARFAAQNPAIRFLDAYAPRAAWQIAETLSGRADAPEIELEAYFRRIGYDGPRAATMEVLRAIQQSHLAAIPFEAIDVLMDRGVDLSPEAVDAKLIRGGRGGYCFEQNGLFKRVLSALGFKVEILIGRVRWMAPAGSPARPRTHMVLQVTLEGEPWLVDVGFGVCVPPAPLRIGDAEPQPTQHETFRVIAFGAPLLVQAKLGDDWMPLYEIPREPQLDVDCELGNWFASAHPTSHFRKELIAARVTPEARTTLLNGRLTIRAADGQAERRFLDADGIKTALGEHFGLAAQPDWRPFIERAAARTVAE
jgi:N-hydroxyarylamine O-acetyltransferase